MVQRALKDSGINLRQLAEDAAVNYGTLRQWAVGHRIPRPDNLQQIAAGMRSRAAKLTTLAEQLERKSGEEQSG
jgi:transcriptional regulator with XRE-family HTH domain